MSEIKINYDQTYASAKKIKTAAAQCSELAQQCMSTVQHIPECMAGNTADALAEALNAWAGEMQNIQNGLNHVGEKIIRVTDSIREAERRTAAAAKKGGGFR